MKLKKQIILFCIIAVSEIAFNNLYSQNVQAKPTRQSSFEAFSQGNYEKAYSEFRELLLTYPKDPLYKYYSGVCLVKLNKDPGEATNLLQQAVQNSGSMKTLPSDGLFYLGRAQQMSGKFTEAAETYNLYTGKVGKKVSKEMGVPEFLQQCNQKKGQVPDAVIKPAEVLNKADADTVLVNPPNKKPIRNTVEKATETRPNMPSNYEKILGEAIEFQFKADSVTAIVAGQKKEMDKLTGAEKSVLKTRILENEKIASALQTIADQKYLEAKLAMNPGQDSALTLKGAKPPTGYKVVKDSSVKAENKVFKVPVKQQDTTKVNLRLVTPQIEVFTFFEVSDKPGADPNAKIVIDPEVPPGLIYRIQMAVFRNPVVPAYFKGISPVYGFKIEGTDKTIYYAGMFRKSSDAVKALAAVKRKGFKDSFIVALSENKRVSSDRAALLEKEWGMKPFYTIETTSPETKADTITPTLTFRVEVTRSLNPLTEDVVQEIKKIAGNRGFDIQLLEDGKIGYLIGKFITFETAAGYADLLRKNGYREAVVVARLGKKEIPIETARQLFDKLK